MRHIVFLLAAVAAMLVAPNVHATPVPVNPVFNGGFEIYVAGGADFIGRTGLDQRVGVGHQVLGCGHVANLIWSSDCAGHPTNRTNEVGAIAADPAHEVDVEARPGQGDLVIVSPAEQNVWFAANWNQYPSGAVKFADNPVGGGRAAFVQQDGAMLYQTFAVASTHSLIPAGTIKTAQFTLITGQVGGGLNLVLDSFPVESPADYPQAFYNYQLWIPASTWHVDGSTITIDPLLGSLSGPAAGGYIAGGVTSHPTSAQWASADASARHDILMKFRVIQFTLQSLPRGDVVDDVAFNVDA